MEALDQLNHLVRIDLDAVRAYTQAIEHVADRSVREMLIAFRVDHERHIRSLSAAITGMGGEPPRQPHLTGFALAGFTGVAAGVAVSGALMAMQSNEIVTNQAYGLALDADLPADIRRLVERNREDERRHLAAIRQRLHSSSLVGAMMSGSATVQGFGTSLWMNVIRANPMATAMAATGAAWLVGSLLGRRSGHRPSPSRR